MSVSDVSLELSALMDEAQKRSGGLTDLGSGPFVDPLKRLIASLESEARLNAIGRVIARERILGHTVNRLHYVNDRKRFPEIAKQEISQPIQCPFGFTLVLDGQALVHLGLGGQPVLHDQVAQVAEPLFIFVAHFSIA